MERLYSWLSFNAMYDTICMYIMHMNGAMYCAEDNVIVAAYPPSGPEPMRRYSLRDEWSLVSSRPQRVCVVVNAVGMTSERIVRSGPLDTPRRFSPILSIDARTTAGSFFKRRNSPRWLSGEASKCIVQ